MFAFFIVTCGDEGTTQECDCSKELAALRAAARRLQQAQANLAQAQAALAADQASLAAAQAAERAAWNAYSAASQLVASACSGIGAFDPLCIVAEFYMAFTDDMWTRRQQALQQWQQAVAAALRLVQLRQQQLQQALQAFRQALLRYILCILRCLFGF
jgi:hypothetical protein